MPTTAPVLRPLDLEGVGGAGFLQWLLQSLSSTIDAFKGFALLFTLGLRLVLPLLVISLFANANDTIIRRLGFRRRSRRWRLRNHWVRETGNNRLQVGNYGSGYGIQGLGLGLLLLLPLPLGKFGIMGFCKSTESSGTLNI